MLTLTLVALSAAQKPIADTLVVDLNDQPLPGEAASEPQGFLEFGDHVYSSARTLEFGDELWRCGPFGENPELVRDANPGPASLSPREMTPVAGGFVFSGDSSTHGRELWFSDGTAAGTVPFVDINPGPWPSSPRELTRVGELVFFCAQNPFLFSALWRTDGTTAGTQRVDFAAGVYGSSPDELTAFGDVLYFRGDEETTGDELWRSDGTVAGTHIVADIWPGTDNSRPESLTAVGDLLYFTADSAADGREPWVSDGTAAGTYSLGNLNPTGTTRARKFMALGDRVLFTASEFGSGVLWSTDGTSAGTKTILALGAGFGELFGKQTLPSGEEVLSFGVHDAGLYRTNGTSAGTELFFPSVFFSFPVSQSFNGVSYFFSDKQFWRTDGTASGTVLLAQETFDDATDLWLAHGALWWRGKEPWRSDGTSIGTQQIADIATIRPTQNGVERRLSTLGDTAILLGHSPNLGDQLFASDGTAIGTLPLGLLDANPWAGGQVLGGELVFRAYAPGSSHRVWKTDGTPAGTVEVSDETEPVVGDFVEHDGWLYFNGEAPGTGRELWATNGESTHLVEDLVEGGPGVYPRDIASAHGHLYFAGSPSGTTSSVDGTYRTAGPTGPVEVLADPTTHSPTPRDAFGFTALNGRVFFVATTIGPAGTGEELWVTDGTPRGTEVFLDLDPGDSSKPRGLVRLGDRLLFIVRLSVDNNAPRMWTTDGTIDGTGPLFPNPRPGEIPPQPTPAVVVGDRAFFAGEQFSTTPAPFTALFATDGTPAGTSRFYDFPDNSKVGQILALDADTAVVETYAPPTGWELWRTNGTRRGTRLLTEIAPGDGGSLIFDIARIGTRLLFVSDDGLHGEELHAIRAGAATAE